MSAARRCKRAGVTALVSPSRCSMRASITLHRNLAVLWTAAAYAAAVRSQSHDPRTPPCTGSFPTAKVVAGFDFVGGVLAQLADWGPAE